MRKNTSSSQNKPQITPDSDFASERAPSPRSKKPGMRFILVLPFLIVILAVVAPFLYVSLNEGNYIVLRPLDIAEDINSMSSASQENHPAETRVLVQGNQQIQSPNLDYQNYHLDRFKSDAILEAVIETTVTPAEPSAAPTASPSPSPSPTACTNTLTLTNACTNTVPTCL